MSREWKPGDVAMVKCADLSERVAIRRAGGSILEAPWVTKDGDWGDAVAYDPRPLVVIDPEDAEQVERLLGLWANQETPACGRRSLVDALREFANPTPPKPDEPTGLGAVVESDNGTRYIRQHDGWWRGEEPCALNWTAVHAVRVLSNGVEATA